MMIFLLALSVSQEVVGRPRFDHTNDIAIAARFLADVRQGNASRTTVTFENREDPKAPTFEAFSRYANECSIKQIYAIPGATQRLPISVEWDCGRFVVKDGRPTWEERFASFRVDNGRVVEATFGKLPGVKIR